MKLEHAKLIAKVAEEIGEDIELRKSYSGRAMYGRSEAGIVIGSAAKFTMLAATAAARLATDESDDADEDDPFCDVDEFCEALGELRSDSMGLDMIFY